MEENQAGDGHTRFAASIERFTALLLDRLAQTPSGKLIDEKETRMLGSVVMRSYSIWMKALASKAKDQALLQEKLRKLRRQLPENEEKEE